METLKKRIMKKLSEVNDPELNIAITDLGLIYDVVVDAKKNLTITMTLTTMGCPLFGLIESQVRDKLADLKLADVDIRLTFDPPWSMEKLSPAGRAKLGV